MQMQCVPSSSVALSPNYSLVGRSRAGDGTTFCIPALKWMFDCGALVEGGGLKQPRVIFMTHTHSDHVFTLTQFTHSRELQSIAAAANDKDKPPPLQIYLPKRAVPFVQDYLDAYEKMVTMGVVEDNNSPGYTLNGVSPGDQVCIKQSGKEFIVHILECVHRVECVGYSIFEKRHKLKDEYQGMPGREIGALKRQGLEVTTSSLHPFLCYLGDTTAEVFEKHPEILRDHSMVVVECSFLDPDSETNAEKTKHMHWLQLKPLVEAHPHILFILIHFSLKYSVLQLRTFFNEEPALISANDSGTNNHACNNVHPMLVDQDLQEEWNAKQQKQPKAYVGTKPTPCNCFVCSNAHANANANAT